MNDSGYIPLVDTTRDELRECIGQARERFDRLIRTADPSARPPGMKWSVQQVVAHVVTVARRYRGMAHGREYPHAAHPRDLDVINQTELEAAMAPIPELANQLRVLAAEMDSYFDAVTNEPPTIPFPAGAMIDGISAQTNWLSELLLHGQDVARAVKAPWELPERDMLLVARGLMQMGPAYLRAAISPDIDVSVAYQLSGARPYLLHIGHGTAEMRVRRPDDRPDAVLRLPASTLALLFYQRIGLFSAVLRGLRITGGRRPWAALKIRSYFEPV